MTGLWAKVELVQRALNVLSELIYEVLQFEENASTRQNSLLQKYLIQLWKLSGGPVPIFVESCCVSLVEDIPIFHCIFLQYLLFKVRYSHFIRC